MGRSQLNETIAGGCVGAAIFPDRGNSEDGLQNILEAVRARHGLPAVGAAVIKGKRLVALKAIGSRKHGSDIKVTDKDKFHLGSCTKAMTATILAKLVEDGKLKWETSIAEVFPDILNTVDRSYSTVTLEQLLAHRSGLSAESWLPGKSFAGMHQLPGTPQEQRRAYVELILQRPPAVEPKEKFIYSNANYSIAAALGEKVTGKSWEVLIEELLFTPLGMSSAGFGPMGQAGAVEEPWQHAIADGQPKPVEPYPHCDNPDVIAPGGKVHCSLADWAKFVMEHLQGPNGGSRLLSAETFKKLHTPFGGGDYALGWGVHQREWGGGTVLSHAGSNTMNFAVVWMAPKKIFAVLVVTNMGGKTAEQACDEAAWQCIQRYLLGKGSVE